MPKEPQISDALRAALSEIDWDKMEEEQPQDDAQVEQELQLMLAAERSRSTSLARAFVDVMAGSLLSEEEKSALFRSSEPKPGPSKS